MKHLEDAECMALWAWAQTVKALRDYLVHIPNGGKRNPREAGRMKKMGVRAGVSDYHLPLRRGKYIGMWLEMKAGKGRETGEQQYWGEKVMDAGHYYVVAYGFDEARSAFEWYLKQ